MKGIVDTLWSSLLKGARGHRQRYLMVDPDVGVQDDRRFAIRRRPGDMGKWAPKGVFYVCMNAPQMAVEMPIFSIEAGQRQIHPQYLATLGARLEISGQPQIQKAGSGYSLHDTKGAFVSFLNLASVHALTEYMGTEIDPRRFRMNIWLTGLQPFEELTWVDAYPGTRHITVGECQFRIDDACERCKAPEANPNTGKHDLEIQTALDEMMGKRGYKSPHRGTPRVMGILAAPLHLGVVRQGDTVTVL